MAADPKISYDATDVMMQALADTLDAGKLRIYESGSAPPTNADDAIAGTLLAELTLNATMETSVTNGVITAAAITSDSDANAAGTADYFRIWDAAGTTCYFQGTAGEAADTTDMTLDDKAITLHATVACSALTLTLARE